MATYLAIDLGTTGCRSILFDQSLRQLAVAYQEYGLITPKEKWTEQDAELWWELTKKTAKEAIAAAGISGKDIRGISISSQGITIVPVDEKLNPLCNALSWLDTRAEEQTAQLEADYGTSAMYLHTGKRIDPCYTLPKMLWLQQERREIFERAWKFLMPMDYLIGKLTGVCATDHSMASGTLFYDIKNLCWSKEILERYGIPEDKLPELRWSGESVGNVLPEVADELGLDPACVVAMGAQDQKCAAFGVGLKDETMTVSLGTAAAIEKRWNEAKTEVNNGVGWCGYVVPGTWVTEGVINTAGTCLRWARDMLFPGEGYDVINAEALEARNRGSSVMFFPYLGGPSCPDFYPESQGCFYGVNLASKRGDFALAVMEGIAFQIRILLEAMEAYGTVKELSLFGGGANSAFWCQIIADATGMKIMIPETTEAAAAGAARLAAMAAGDPLPALEFSRIYIPSELSVDYAAKYKKFREIEKRLWALEDTK